MVVELGRIVIRLWFLLHPNQAGKFLGLVQMVGQRVAVVKKFGVDRPLAVLAPQGLAEQRSAQLSDCVDQQHFVHGAACLVDNIAQPFIGRGQRAVVSFGRR